MSELHSTCVPYLDLRAQYESIKDELEPAMREVFESSAYVLGPSVERFETAFAAFCSSKHCVAVNNGTAALHLALLAAGIGPGDEVITQANTFIATVAAITYTGATPVLVDVAPPSYTIDLAAIEAAITPRTRAIVPVHLYGQPCDLDAIRTLADKYGLLIVEDASQAHGATYHGRTIGSGDIVTFSFYPGKNLGAAGEGGCVVTQDDAINRRLRVLRNHGSEAKYFHDSIGYNYRLEGLQGAILGVKLKYLAHWTSARRRVAKEYDALLQGVERPLALPETESAHHVYPVLYPDRDAVALHLRELGIETNVHYPVPCHLQKGYAFLGYSEGQFPNSERLAKTELSLPIFPELTSEKVRYVAQALDSIRAKTSSYVYHR